MDMYIFLGLPDILFRWNITFILKAYYSQLFFIFTVRSYAFLITGHLCIVRQPKLA